jgi:transposase
MGMGRREVERQGLLWVATGDAAQGPRHVFYEKLNSLLAEAGFDTWIEEVCEPFYAKTGRKGIPPGIYFRMLFVGYFEGIDSQRGIAWRCEDSLSLKRFLGFEPFDDTPDHSSLSRIRGRLPLEVFEAVHEFVLEVLHDHQLINGTLVGVDSTTLEANAAMKSIVRKDTGEDWEAYVRRLAEADGVEIKSKSDLIRYDKDRNKRGKKKVSNEEWTSPADPDARIARMKDGRTHLAYKAEHVVDLKTEAIIEAEVYHTTEADTATLVPSLEQAQDHLDKSTGLLCDIKKVVADTGYHAVDTLKECRESLGFRSKTYIPERQRKTEWDWSKRTEAERKAVTNNRHRTQRAYGKRLQRRRSEVVERGFAHVCETGGGRRSWLRGIDNVRKRHLLGAVSHNLGLVLRKLLGTGKVRQFAVLCSRLSTAVNVLAVPLSRLQPSTAICSHLFSIFRQDTPAQVLTA